MGGIKLTPKEMSAQVTSAMPLYARNISTATCLHSAILRLNTCEDIPIKGKGTYNKLPSVFKAKPALHALLDKHSNNPIPDVLVTFTGITSISRSGQSTPVCY
ncbi:uncharacterized protein FFE2_03027 [Fusarium fujikuroi]|nr:uncharacterized protein FFE2_03027 [Fusarium fujikuroi]